MASNQYVILAYFKDGAGTLRGTSDTLVDHVEAVRGQMVNPNCHLIYSINVVDEVTTVYTNTGDGWNLIRCETISEEEREEAAEAPGRIEGK